MPESVTPGAGVGVAATAVAAAIPPQPKPGVGGWVTLPAGRGEGGDSGVDRGLAGSGRAALPGSRRLVLKGAPPGGPGCGGCLVASVAGVRLPLVS